ncbi:serine/threonine-protein phosphatase 6 regulatory ankyrin repeat subunit B-like [Mytilus edulis]|uniref:serine/threonine-protein phosphatase 6 regulatory ankyrin repeat subunit B-like n=1 Tax=Mytilus edulis TaxID=6550 RepID=UPI0039EE437A
MASSNPFTDFFTKYTTDYTAASKSDLHKAAVDGDVECVVKLLNGGDVQIDLEDDRGNTPLYMAVQNNHFQVVKTLIQYGACVNPKCVPLNIVRNFEIAKLLVDSGSSVTAVDELGNNPLHKATEFGNDRIAELFLNNGADINQTNHNGQNALHLACKNSSDENRFQTVQMLIRYGIDVSTLDNLKRSPLHHACQNAKTNNIIGLLVAKNAVLKKHDFQGMCPIHYLLDHYHLYDPEDETLFLAGIDKLLQGEDCANVTDAAGKTPLHYSAEKTNDRIVSFLVSRGSNANISDGFGRTPLHFVNSGKTCSVLTSRGCKPDITDFWGQAAVNLATERMDIEIVEEMINNGTNFDEGDVKGRTILHIAASNGSDDIVMLLLKIGINANMTDNYSNTPLHLATWNDNASTVDLLLENRGDPYFKDENGNTAFDLSLYRSSKDTIDILLKYTNRTSNKESQCKFTNYADSLMHLDDFEKLITCNGMIKTSEPELNNFVGKLFENEMPYSRNCESEVKDIQLAVEAMASVLADMVSKHDPIFKCTLLHIGSVSEGTKVRYPDEFDFTFCLDVISAASNPQYKEEETMTQIAVALPYSTGNNTISEAFIGIEPEEEVTSIAGYAYLRSSNKIISSLLSEWASEDDLLSGYQMNYLFSKLLTKVMFASDFPKDERLIIKEVTAQPEVLL